MRLLRIDADFESDKDEQVGCLTVFANTPHLKAHLLRWLSGWDCDCYEEDAELTDAKERLLVGPTWPQLPTAELLALAREPKVDAARQLDEILERRGT
jgi:hypothetical protein